MMRNENENPHAPFQPDPKEEQAIDELIAKYPTKRAACLPLLHMCQRRVGWISPEVIDFVAKRLEMSTAEVKGIVTFYTMYHHAPVGKHVIWVCRTLSCELRGAKTIQEHLERRLGCRPGQTSRDGRWTLKKAECLAGCGYAPVVQIDDRYYEELTPAKLDAILDQIEKGEMPPQSETPWRLP
ncbi:MAG: NADH-quinone oxidoreductase subunit NuoE [Sandaracinaceae bacterium]|nr:NADH-quinone oxidoreductase subunit NuoE [Sandaracinaceae bacterium]